jgi:hypothetical protein
MDALLGRLREGGLKAELVDHAYHALDSHIIGFTLWVLPYVGLAAQSPNLAQDFLETLPVDELPDLLDHIRYHMAERVDGTPEFDFGLDLILDGLERLR